MDNYNNLNLPKTKFKMKANLPNNEPNIMKDWDKVYHESIRGEREFILHDGPPYANGDIHAGTALNKILKDAILKYKRLQGYRAEYIPGWDCHGLPIELAVTKKHSSSADLRPKFRAHAEKYIRRQQESFKRLGVLADWDRKYTTMSPEYSANELNVFAELVEKGKVYQALKPVYWCVATRTAIADSEAVYKEHKSTSIYFTFKGNKDLEDRLELKNINLVIWTTTPWTLPANLAVSLNPNIEYSVLKRGEEHFIVASDLVESIKEKIDLGEEVKRFIGAELENTTYSHPFIDRVGRVILGEHVTSESGTGCVHTAPGHGMEDYVVCKRYSIDPFCPVDEKGYMTEEAGPLKGYFYKEANIEVLSLLGDNLLLSEEITHSYPYSDRGKVPIIFRATKQWFIDVQSMKSDALKAIEDVEFYPSSGRKRLSSTIENRPDWCISRQRVWGLPIPAFHSESDVTLDSKVIRKVADVVKKVGSDLFFNEEYSSNLKELVGDKSKDSSTFDVWFDAGCSFATVLGEKKADLYLEGSDQHRGWFQSALFTSIGSNGQAPYKNIITHGYVVDGQGIKMSKSIGNTINPQDVIKEYGADILRIWASSVDYFSDIKISSDILKQSVDNYRKIRNSFRFILGNIHDLDQPLEYDSLENIDKVTLGALQKMITQVEEQYNKFSFHTAMPIILSFVTEISSFYFDIIKDRLYCDAPKSNKRVSAQTVLKIIGNALCKILSPILSFTSEEVWSYLGEGSIFLQYWPKLEYKYYKEWNKILKMREKVNSEIESLISSNTISSSSEVVLDLVSNIEMFSEAELAEIFKVAYVNLEKGDFNIKVSKIDGHKCSRCWRYFYSLDGDVCSRCKEV